MAVKIQLRRDTASNWSTNNPVLAEGEIGIEIDTTLMKVGDGTSAWNDLPYMNDLGIKLTQFTVTSSSGSATVDWKNGTNAVITLTENTTISFSNPGQPCHLQLLVKQDSTGGYTLTLPTIKWAGGVSPTLSTAANNVSIISLYWDGTDYYGMAIDSFA